MTRRMVCLLGVLVFASPALGEQIKKMTLKQARARLPKQKLPAFWIGDVKDLPQRWRQLKRGQAKVIATSPGGRPVHLIAYGQKEHVPSYANFNSAIGAREPKAYMDKDARSCTNRFGRFLEKSSHVMRLLI